MSLSFKEARSIRMGERDVELGLGEESWPGRSAPPDGWVRESAGGLLSRRIGAGEDRRQFATPLAEKLLRFPSAPIHGLHRLSQEHVNMGPVETFHTYRLLSHPERQEPVSRVFLMHNGLNETSRLGLYYQLASYLIDQDPNTVCLLRPFPGHLTRCAYPGLSETPLDHYLWDGLHLFRQFLRYMIETRWLLSTIVRYSYYHCVSGSGLLGQSKGVNSSRLSPNLLAAAMAGEWGRIYAASGTAIERQGDGSPAMPEEPGEKAFEQAIVSLRRALELDRYPKLNGSSFDTAAEPELHALGYSLGGFTAQSVFMSWPFLVSSCSTLLSGGAMRELAPTAFADPEEWQTVLHSLRYELDDAMMDWRFAASGDGLVVGIDMNLFRYLKRTFYEVFQQEYRGSFQTRLVSFRQRMLFVVGGNDPIVRPQSVLDSGPPDGINMLAVGGLGHFLESGPQGKSEKEQRAFWLPEIGRTVGRLAGEAAGKHRADLADTWLGEDDLLPDESGPGAPKAKRKALDRLSIAERLEVERDGTLPNTLFQRSLDDLLARATDAGDGLLFILKNEPPTFLLGRRALQQHASALYHEDVGIVDYVKEVGSRRAVIEEHARDRICVVLPWNVHTIMQGIDAGLQHPSQSESSGEQVSVPHDPETSWRDLFGQCVEWTRDPFLESIRVFDGSRDGGRTVNPDIDDTSLSALSAAARAHLKIDDPGQEVIPALPDCWVWMSNEFLGLSNEDPAPIKLGIQRLCEKAPGYLGKGRERKIAERLRSDSLRMVTVSRARYNPRFRGRIIAEPRPAQEALLRVALCIVSSVPFRRFEFE